MYMKSSMNTVLIVNATIGISKKLFLVCLFFCAKELRYIEKWFSESFWPCRTAATVINYFVTFSFILIVHATVLIFQEQSNL